MAASGLTGAEPHADMIPLGATETGTLRVEDSISIIEHLLIDGNYLLHYVE